MEYPNQVYITESIDNWEAPLSYKRHWLELIIAHELGHQWWYNLVGNDEIDVGFLDEGITCWSTDYYGEYYYGDWEHFQNTPYIQEVRIYYNETSKSSKINQTIYECIDNYADYWYIAYIKAPLIFEKLRQTIGHSNFIAGLRLYFESYQYKLVVLSDMQQAFETVIGQSLDWFFFPWFDNLYLPKYSFSEHNYNAATKVLNITIEDINEPLNDYAYSQQVPLAVYNASGYVIYSQDVWINGTTELSLSLSANSSKVSLLYNNYVLVQLNTDYDLSLDLIFQSTEPDPDPDPVILGYDMSIFILLSANLIGISIVVIKRKVKKLK
jgi:aminopeptidase N